jgi:hypothetical protein
MLVLIKYWRRQNIGTCSCPVTAGVQRLAHIGAQPPVPSRLVVPVRHARNPQNIGVDKISTAILISLFFTELWQSISLLLASNQKTAKVKNGHPLI